MSITSEIPARQNALWLAAQLLLTRSRRAAIDRDSM